MCGRVALYTPVSRLAELVGVEAKQHGEMNPRFNIAPGQTLWNAHRRLGDVGFEAHTWGLVPHWAKAMARKHINARAETLSTAAPFRDAFARGQRSLIFVDGFYEWRTGDPYYISRRDDAPLALAAIYDIHDAQENPYLGCAIVTTPSNITVAEVHDRMPAILAKEDWEAWLDPRYRDRAVLTSILRPVSAEVLRLYRVSRQVNSVSNDGAELIDRLGA